MKKVIAIMLTIIMALTVCIMPASATDGTAAEVSNNIVENAIEDYFQVATGVDEDAQITVSDDLVEKVAESASINDAAVALSEIVFVKAADVDDETLAALLEDTDCTVSVLDDGSVELYIGIDLAEHPELFKIAVFRSYVKAVVDNSDAYYEEHGYDPENTETTLHYDSYLRFAGELALHMIVYDTLYPFSGFVTDSIVDQLVNHAVYAEINQSESRAPEFVLIAIGWFFMNLASRITLF